MSSPSRLLLLAVLAITSACGDGLVAPAADLSALLQTSGNRFELSRDEELWTGEVEYTFENRTGGPVFIPNCKGMFGLVLERLMNDGWRTAWGPLVPDCQSPLITIPPGQTHEFVLTIWGGDPGAEFLPAFSVDPIQGTYRIRWSSALSAYNENQLPAGPTLDPEHSISNPFLLTLD
jgi:hypothetical protein